MADEEADVGEGVEALTSEVEAGEVAEVTS